MDITLRKILVRELANDYMDEGEDGVRGYGGSLDIRPPYQREFVYKDKQRNAVIDTVTKDFPLNVMYWAVREDGNYEIIDGQQRTISLCQYVNGDFSFNNLYFHNLPKDRQDQILDYELMVYLCSGTDSERLEWFRTINIAGEPLTVQELRNAVYAGSWVTDAKRYFSKSGCAAYSLAKDYMSGIPIRQDYLETAIKWHSRDDIENYMALRQHNGDASGLWLYFQQVIAWVKTTFPTYRREMKGVAWGDLYNEHGQRELVAKKLEEEIARFMQDDDVTDRRGIYYYILDRKEKHLNIRAFTESQRRQAYERQNGICPDCKNYYELNEMEADHITPWHEGGKTIPENCQMLCKEDNRRKSGK